MNTPPVPSLSNGSHAAACNLKYKRMAFLKGEKKAKESLTKILTDEMENSHMRYVLDQNFLGNLY